MLNKSYQVCNDICIEMKFLSSLSVLLVLVTTLPLPISISLGVYILGISSKGMINYPERLSRLHVEGKYIKDDFGRTVYLRGVDFRGYDWWNLGHTEEDQLRLMSEWGCNVVRITTPPDLADKWDSSEDFRLAMDRFIDWAKKYRMYVILAGYAVWGESTPSHNLGSWSESNWQNCISHWQNIATRYKGKSNILYDLLNEADGISGSAYRTRVRSLIDAIRSIDSDVICVVNGLRYNNVWMSIGFEQDYPIDRRNIIFGPHLYYADAANPIDKTSIRNTLRNKSWTWCLQNNRCVWVAEFNADAGTFPNGATWMRNFIEVLDEDGYPGWCAWNWGDRTRYALCTDWNGNPSQSGSIIREYLVKS